MSLSTGTISVDTITGAISLPTGAATSSSQTTGNNSLSSIDSKTPTLVSGRQPVDGSGVTQPVSGTVTANAGTNLNTSALALDTSVNSLLKPASTLAAVTSITNTVVIKADTAGNQANALKIDGSATTQPVSGTITANQGGTWNITNVSGTVSLPTGASTSALQTTGNSSLSSIDTKTPALGQAAMASSVPVAIASNQTGINTFLDKNATGSITALNQTITVNTNGASNVFISVLGTWTATLLFEGQAGDSSWNNLVGIAPAGGVFNGLSSNASVFVPVGGCTQFRVRASAFVSGSATVTINSSSGAQSIQVFNSSAASLQATVTGTLTANETKSATATLSNVAGSTSSVTILASNAARIGAFIYNDSTLNNLFVKLGTTASATSFTVLIPSQGYFELPTPIYTGIITGIWVAATGSARVTETT